MGSRGAPPGRRRCKPFLDTHFPNFAWKLRAKWLPAVGLASGTASSSWSGGASTRDAHADKRGQRQCSQGLVNGAFGVVVVLLRAEALNNRPRPRKVRDLATLAFVETRTNIVLLGPPGAGARGD